MPEQIADTATPPRPAFMILGAQKSGTTWLYHTLNSIPGLRGSVPKETRFFFVKWRKEYDTVPVPAIQDLYLQHWPDPDERLQFEASPGYIVHREAAARIHAHFPNTRFVVILRDPIMRAFSVYNMWCNHNHFAGGFKDLYAPALDELKALRQEFQTDAEWFDVVRSVQPRTILSHGLYQFQFENWFRLFPREQFFIMTTKQLRDIQTLRNLIKHVGGRPSWIYDSDLQQEVKNAHIGPAIASEDYEALENFFAPYNQRFFEFLGVSDLDW